MVELVAGPLAEPLTCAQAKEFLRIDHNDEDALIDALITAARRWVEARTGRVLISQSWSFTRDEWPMGGILPSPLAPVRSVREARIRRDDGVEVVLPEGVVRASKGGGGLLLVDLARAPQPAGREAISITVEAGYGGEAADVPADLVQAIRLMVAHFYEQRDGAEETSRPPQTATELVAPYRLVRL